MQDRVSLYPGRIKLTPVSGQNNVYDMERADQPTQEGDTLNKNTLLKDSTAEALGLSDAALPDDALRILSRLHAGLGEEYLWAKIANSSTIVTGTGIANYALVNDSETSATVQYSDEVTLSGSEIVLTNPVTLTVTLNNLGAATVLNEKYVNLVSTVASTAVIYCTYASGVDYFIQGRLVSVGTSGNVVGYVNSANPNAYPINDGYTYVPMGQLGAKTQIATGSYTGTGTYGASNPNSLTFDFVPKLLFIFGYSGTPSAIFPVTYLGTSYKSYGYGILDSSGFEIDSLYFAKIVGTTVSWYTTISANYQENNTTSYGYQYFAIG